MSWADWLWEFIDNGVYALTVLACVVLLISAGACPAILLAIRQEVRELRQAVEAIPPCQCRCRAPLLPLPIPRRIGEEAD
jgi:hypothetical protein